MKWIFHKGECVWRHRDLRLLGSGRAISALGDELALIALVLYVYDTGAGSRGITLVLASASAPAVVLAPWAGRLVDRNDSRLLVMGSAFFSALACLGLAFASGLVVICALVIGLQIGQTIAGPTWQALIPRVVGETEIGKAIGSTQALYTVASLAGVPLGGWLSSVSTKRVPLLVDAATFALLGIVGRAVRTRRGDRTDQTLRSTPPPRLFEGLWLVRTDPLLQRLLAMLLFFILAAEAVNVAEIFLVRDEANGSATEFGLLGMAMGAGVILGSIVVSRLTTISQHVVGIVIGVTLLSTAMVLTGLWPILGFLFVVQPVCGIGQGLLNGSVGTVIMSRVNDAHRGQVSASVNGLARSCSIIALLLGGGLVGWLGPAHAFLASGFAGLFVVVLLTRSVLLYRSGQSHLDEVASGKLA